MFFGLITELSHFRAVFGYEGQSNILKVVETGGKGGCLTTIFIMFFCPVIFKFDTTKVFNHNEMSRNWTHKFCEKKVILGIWFVILSSLILLILVLEVCNAIKISQMV